MEREEKNNNQTMAIVAVLCALLFGISIAYAVLSTTLTITMNQVTQQGLTWDVGFEPGTVNGTKTGSADASCGVATVTANNVSVANTVLATLGDQCVYPLTIKNTGSINAELSTIVAAVPSSISCDTNTTSQMVCGNTTYKITTDSAGLSLLGTGNILAANTGTLDVYLTVSYTGTATGSDSDQNGGGFTLAYSQK